MSDEIPSSLLCLFTSTLRTRR